MIAPTTQPGASRPEYSLTDIGLVALLCFICFFLRLGAIGLFDFNEGLYVSAAADMYHRGDWLLARVNGIPFWDKPYLALWQDALSFRIFGVNEFAARLPVAIAAAALVVLTWWFGARYFGRRAGLLAGSLLALSPLFFGTARQMTMDIHQSLWFAAAMIGFFLGSRAETARGKRWYYLSWASCGLAVLAKSVPGFFPLFLCFVYTLFEQRFRPRAVLCRIWETRIALGLPLMAAIITPWFWASTRQYGDAFWNSFFWHHHVALLTGQDFGHARPIWYYVPALLWGMFPVSLFLPWAMRRPRTEEEPDERASARRFLLVWSIVLFAMFSLMTSKVVSYLLPLYPALALLGGDWLSRTIDAHKDRVLPVVTSAIALLAIAAYIVGRVEIAKVLASENAGAFTRSVPNGVVQFAFMALLFLFVGASLAAVLIWLGRRSLGLFALVSSMAAVIAATILIGLPAMEEAAIRPLTDVVKVAAKRMDSGYRLAVCVGNPWRPSLYFYLPAKELMKPTNPGFGGRIILDEYDPAKIQQFLEAHRPAYVLIDNRRVSELQSLAPGLTAEVVSTRYTLLRADQLHFGNHGIRP